MKAERVITFFAFYIIYLSLLISFSLSLSLSLSHPHHTLQPFPYSLGPRPTLGKGTLIYLPVTSNREFTKDKSKWDARMHSAEGNRVHVQIHVPANVAVAVWRLRVSTKQQGSRNIKSYYVKENIYVLFNAWSKGKSTTSTKHDSK